MQTHSFSSNFRWFRTQSPHKYNEILFEKLFWSEHVQRVSEIFHCEYREKCIVCSRTQWVEIFPFSPQYIGYGIKWMRLSISFILLASLNSHCWLVMRFCIRFRSLRPFEKEKNTDKRSRDDTTLTIWKQFGIFPRRFSSFSISVFQFDFYLSAISFLVHFFTSQ